jgi:hypothetical protein
MTTAPAPLTLDEMVAILKKYIELPDYQYPMILLFALHSRLGGVLPNELCLYMLFVGKTSTGKSHCAQLTTEISNGIWLKDTSEAFLLDVLDVNGEVKTMGVDQLEDAIERNPNLAGIVETTNEWNCNRGIKLRDSKGKWTSTPVRCGGPKVFSALGLSRMPLVNRSYVIWSIPGKDPVELFATFVSRHADVARINGSLDLIADGIRMSSPTISADVAARVLSREHKDRCKKFLLDHPGVEARRLALCHIFELTNWLSHWGVDVFTPLGYDLIDESEETFRHFMRSVVTSNNWMGDEVQSLDILKLLNEKYHEHRLETLNETTLGTAMRDIGFTTDAKLKRRSNDGQLYHFNRAGLALLGLQGPTTQTTLSKKTIVWGTKGLRP